MLKVWKIINELHTYNIMENHSENQDYHHCLNELLKHSTQEALEHFLAFDSLKLQDALTNCQKTFFGQVEWNLISIKRKLLGLLGQKYAQLREQELNIFKGKIVSLATVSERLVKEGIFSIYSGFLDLLENVERGNFTEHFHQLLIQTISAIEPVLRDYFLIKKMDNMMESQKEIQTILSEKLLNLPSTSTQKCPSSKQFKDYEIFKSINREIQDRTIQELIDEEIDRKDYGDEQEKCRICEDHISLNNLERHVQYCSKKQGLKAQRENIVELQEEIIVQMKQEIKNGSQLEEEINKIYKTIILNFTKKDRIHRKNSVMDDLKIGSKEKQFYFFLQEAEDKFPEDELLQRFNQFEKQKTIIEKRIKHIQLQFISSNNSADSIETSNKSIRSSRRNISKTKKPFSIKTKKSLFAPKQSFDDDSCKQNSTQRKIRCEKTEKHGKWRESKDKKQEEIVSFFNIQNEKLHKSLTSISFNEQSRAIETKFKNFEVLSFLGKGAFGKVYLVRRKNTMDVYAMKVIKIQQNWGQSELSLIENEHQIFRKIGGDYLVKASFSFNEGCAHFFVLEYMPRGDLSKILQEEVYLEYQHAKFYLAEIILALEHLHCFQIVHRDLKPENLVIDEKGHLKLTDFGLSQIRIQHKLQKAKQMDNNHHTSRTNKNQLHPSSIKHLKNKSSDHKSNAKIIGTPDYIAPEIIQRTCLNSPSSDWWSLGVLAYEMLIGCRPFADDTVDQVIDNILEQRMTWPEIGDEEDMISPVAADLIKKLLDPNYETRLGARDVQEIKSHPFFEGIDWEEIREYTPPFLPKANTAKNLSSMQADESLHHEIMLLIKNKKKDRAPSLKMSNFVNYDFLMNETLDSAQKNIEQQNRRILKMKTFVHNHHQEGRRRNMGKRVSIDVPSFDLPHDL